LLKQLPFRQVGSTKRPAVQPKGAFVSSAGMFALGH
jgi:hypothetical protein